MDLESGLPKVGKYSKPKLSVSVNALLPEL